MALPGVRTVLKDRFYSLSRSEAPEDVRRVGIIARRNLANADYPDYDPYLATGEEKVIEAFGENSELHRGYLEAVSGGAGRVILIPVPSTVTDTDYESVAPGNPVDNAFDAVEAAEIDIVVAWGRGSHPTEWENPATPTNDPGDFGFVANNSSAPETNLAIRIANKCKEITDRSHPVFGVIGLKPFVGTSQNMIPSEVISHYTTIADLPDRDNEALGENGGYVSVVSNEIIPAGYKFTTYGYANGAATYAGFVSGLPPQNAPTGKPLYNVSGLRCNIPRTVQEALVDQGIVPIATDFTRAAVVVDGLTFARSTSDYTRLATMRIVFGATQLIRRACRSYIGKPATRQHQNSMETAISNRLRSLMVSGVLLGADFAVSYRPAQNKAVIDLVLQPAFEIRNIEIQIAVQI